MWELALNVAGGVLAGCAALTVGGLGVLLALMRQVKSQGQALIDVSSRLESEIKRRNGERGTSPPVKLRDLGPLRGLVEPPEDPNQGVARGR